MRLLPFSLISLLPLWLALLPACTVTNTSHCGNQKGDATCSERSAATPYCSICVADNDGCVAELPENSCHSATEATSTTTVDDSSGTTPPTSTPTGETTTPTTSETSQTTTSTSDTQTSAITSETSAMTSTGSTDPATTTTGDTDTSTSTGSTENTTTTSSTGDSTTSSTGDTESTGTTMMGPMCGNNMVEGDEVCDGTDLDGETCKTVVEDKWGGGMLKCNEGCASFDDTSCCIGVGQPCNPLMPSAGVCCPPLTCQADMLLGSSCQN